MSDGAWIFLSHSHKDFDKVRDLRNELELQRHHPLMFFLKCLDDTSEIDDLIRREIEARSWFILCDSTNARTSHWVQEERRIIAALPDHTSSIVDLDQPLRAQIASVSGLTLRASVFLSYTQADAAMARRVEASLRDDDFGVFSDLQIPPGVSWQTRIAAALDAAVGHGAVLALLSQASVTSQRREVMLALERAEPGSNRRNIVALFLEPPDLVRAVAGPDRRDLLGRIQGFDLSASHFARGIAEVKRWLRGFEWRPLE